MTNIAPSRGKVKHLGHRSLDNFSTYPRIQLGALYGVSKPCDVIPMGRLSVGAFPFRCTREARNPVKMASLRVGKSAVLLARRCLIRPNIRTMAAGGGIPEHSEHVTGLEKKELEMIKAGNTDPFELHVKRVPAGTRDQPVVVKSVFDKRIVGCICEEEQTFINWMWLHAGEAQRCDCGHWFQLEKAEPIQ